MQVTASKARQPACNGVYTKHGTCNDRDVYQHASGACIFYDDAKSSWVLTASADIQELAYIRQSDDDDIVPPNGEWRGHNGSGKCYVKAAFVAHVYENHTITLLSTCSLCAHAHVE